MIDLDGEHLTVEQAVEVVFAGEPVRPTPEALEAVESSARLVEEIVRTNRRVYGINTGLGKLSRVTVPVERLGELQENLLRSHACGVGEPLPDEVSRAALLFRLNSLLQGYSGVRRVVIDLLGRMLNRGICPLIPGKGSMGSSGDLALLAHMALLLIGEGEARVDGRDLSAAQVLKELGTDPLELAPKEGLALINGTQVALARGFHAYCRARSLLSHAQLLACMALEAAGGSPAPLDPRLHSCQRHSGQRAVAEGMRAKLEGSRLVGRSRDLQDPYTLRCAPQVLGALEDVLRHTKGVIEAEMNAASDNPLLFPESGEALSGGNFHGESLALALEYLGMAVAEMGGFSERRIALLLELPDLQPFLVEESGLNTGLMVPQYTAASLVSENSVLAHPGAVGSIPTSGGQEDYNSLASVSAWKAYHIAENVEYILAIELMTVAQALDFRELGRMAPVTRRAHERVRDDIPHLSRDRMLHRDIEAARALIRGGDLLGA